ncbi:hypothetical protein [Brevundimonas sp.]|uniref:hypothetical protein n=1 Tax=Brevundimonas sp. TaxID=1871086 RepID=UPI003AFF9503
MKSSDFDAYLTLRRASDNSTVAEDDDGAGSGTDARIGRTLDAAGDYIIEARGFSDEAEGDYTLKVTETAPPPPPTPAVFGQAVEGEISDTSRKATMANTITPTPSPGPRDSASKPSCAPATSTPIWRSARPATPSKPWPATTTA